MNARSDSLLHHARVTAAAIFAALVVCGCGATSARNHGTRAERPETALAKTYGSLPLAFEANGGRTDKRVDFIARGAGYTLFTTPGESVLALGHGKRSDVIRTRLLGASHSRGRAERRLPGVVNSFVGNDESKWRTKIPTYRAVRYASVYPGIDLLYYGNHRRLEYDFVLEPGADPNRIALSIAGNRRLRVDRGGNLVIPTRAGPVKHLAPVAYQGEGAGRQRVAARYVLRDGHVRVHVGRYDHSRRLVIDPVLGYSTFLGGASSSEEGSGIAVGADGSAYVAGYTLSTDFPLASPLQSTRAGFDVFITKINPSGTALVYSTFLGGTGTDYGRAIDVDDQGSAYVVGETSSSDFPVPGGADTTFSGGDAFATKINASGASLGWSTYIGGSGGENALGVAVDSSHDAHVVGYTTSTASSTTPFPVSTNAFQASSGGNTDTFLTVLNYSLLRRIACNFTCPALARTYSTYLGGSLTDYAQGVDVDDNGNTYVAGFAGGTFPTKLANQTDQTGQDGFVAKFDTSQGTAANTLVYSTFFGGNGTDEINAISVTPTGVAHVVGKTDSTNLPGLSPNPALPFDHVPAGDDDGFVSQLSSTPNISLTAYIGGQADDSATGIAVRVGSATTEYIVGQTKSDDLKTVNDISSVTPTLNDPQVFAVKRYPSSGSPAVWWTYLGGLSNNGDFGTGIALDPAGSAYVTGSAGFDWPTTPGAFQTQSRGGNADAIAARIDQLPPTIDPGSPLDGAVLTTNSASFSYRVAEADRTFRCSNVVNGHLSNATRVSCTNPPKVYSGLADGQHTFEVVSVDNALDESNPAAARRTFTVDTQPPAAFDLVEPADSATTDTQPTLTWQQATDLGTAVIYHVIIDGIDVQQVPDSSCANGQCSAQIASPLVTGTRNWSIRAVDGANHTRDSASTRSLIAVSPPTAKFTIAPNPALTGRTVTFDGSGSADASHTIAKYEWDLDGDGSFEVDNGPTPTTTKSYPAPGTFNISLRITDGSGLTAATSNELRVSSLGTSNLLGVTIDNGAQYTRSPDVTVTANFPAGTTQMLFSNDGGFIAPSPFPPAKDTKWKLDSSGPERLPKTIYVRFFTGPFPGETFQDDIILDETPPKVTQAAVTSAAGVASNVATASKSKTKSWKLKIKASDSNSGVAKVQATSNKKKPGKLLKYKRKLTVKSAKRPRWVRARDRAGNYSRWRKAR